MGGLVQHLQFDSEASWLQKVRSQGLSAFTAQGVPTAKTEAWKYTKPRELCADDYILTHLSGVEDDIELPFDGYVFHFDNGILVSPLPQLPAGVEVIPLAQALQNDFAQDYIGQAAVVANAGGRTLGKLLSANISTYSGGMERSYGNMKLMAAADRAAAPETSIAAQEITIKASVDTVFAME